MELIADSNERKNSCARPAKDNGNHGNDFKLRKQSLVKSGGKLVQELREVEGFAQLTVDSIPGENSSEPLGHGHQDHPS